MDSAALLAAYDRLKHGSLWSSTGKCKGYAIQNPGEAQKIDAYVDSLAAGNRPAPPVLATDTGNGIVGMLAAMAFTPPPPRLKAFITGEARQGETLTGSFA